MTVTRPKILFMVTEDWYFRSHRLDLAVAAGADYEVAVICRCNTCHAQIEAAGVRVIPFAFQRSSGNPLRALHEVRELIRILRKEAPDLVHVVALRPIVLGGIAARITGVPRVVSALSGLGYLFSSEGRNPLLRFAILQLLRGLLSRGVTIVQNDDDAQALHDLQIPKKGIRKIRGTGIDLAKFSPPTSFASNEPPVVMFAARLIRDKGIGVFVDAARRFKAAKARFVIVGGLDPENPTAITEAELAGWVDAGIVEWWGHRSDMHTCLAEADIFCLPSAYREGLPKVVLEAMACARPCIVTDAPGCREAVKHEETGLHVPVNDAAALADAIERLIKDRDLRRQYGAAARAHVQANFSKETIEAQSLDVYRDLFRET